MSVIHQLSAGWLVDHLSFINKSGYQLCHCCTHPAWDSDSTPTTSTSSTGDAAALATSDTICSSMDAPVSESGMVQRVCETPKEKYVFREEFFHIFKPYITAAPQQRPQQRNSETHPSGVNGSGVNQKEKTQSGDQDCAVRTKKKCKRRRTEFNQGELDALEYHTRISGLVLDGTMRLVQEGLQSGFLYLSSAKQACDKNIVTGPDGCDLAELCEMAKWFPSIIENEHQAVKMIKEEMSIPEQDLLSCVTENKTNWAKMVHLMGQKYLLPPKSSFLLSDISYMQPLLDCKGKYGIIVIDTPWENKSVKRSNRYDYLSSWQLKQIPIPALADPNCLVVTCVTNRQKHLQFVKKELYSHWSVKTLAEWYWVKITRSGEFVFPLDSSHKKPYEVLVLGRVQGNTDLTLRKPQDEVLPVPDHKLIVSVPCTLHSHKPPLAEVLSEYTKPDVKCLELFARNLQRGWTSWGNEVLKFQHIDYFIAAQNEN
uniref:Methyltransferase 4, N6-adenosine n=1 Tax=Sphenodon punctatus TaxID=8508 RepID=A0A8D0GYX7_SPHPU